MRSIICLLSLFLKNPCLRFWEVSVRAHLSWAFQKCWQTLFMHSDSYRTLYTQQVKFEWAHLTGQLKCQSVFSCFQKNFKPISYISPECCSCCADHSCQEPGSLFHHTDFQLLERILQIKQQTPNAHTTQQAVVQICFPFLVGVSRTSFF